MKSENIEYRDGDTVCRGYLVWNETISGKRPGILVMPEALGLGPHAKARAERLASLGYVALAGDPYGNGLLLDDLQQAIARATQLMSTPGGFRARGRAALDRLAALPQVDPNRLGAIGFCMGGSFALELARDGAPLKAVVGFHSGLQTQKPATSQIKTKILVCLGADDPLIPFDAVKAFEEEMTQAKADWQVIHYGGTVHSFTNPEADRLGNPAIAYNRSADERSWKSMRALFDEVFTSN
ncbi:MAG TPA: dienelactone hydrolase family protein [Candidatus Binataceae bacterium]|nr:dienelactone hydrolase family protein [Candidatus Binataceae bacterium]